MTPIYSVLHATWGRPEKAISTMRMWFSRADHPNKIDYIFALNEDDLTANRLVESLLDAKVRIVTGMFSGSAPAWSAAAKISKGQVLVQASDDMEPPAHWDTLLQARLGAPDVPEVIAVADGFRKDELMTTAICNRARYEQCGEFLHAGYWSVFSDDEFTVRAYRDERYGKCRVVEARDLVFLHRHHYHDKTIPFDATYARQNAIEAYRLGAELFERRNPWVRIEGYHTWG